HEGFYAYFTSGANRGRQYLIIDSVEAATDTMTILSAQANTTFTAGDGFTIVDRVYAREGGSTNGSCTSTTENLCITKAGSATSDITWKGSGTVIIDGQRARQRGIYVAVNYQTIDGFVGINHTLYGTDIGFTVNYISVLNSTFADNGSGGTDDSGLFFNASVGARAHNNVLLRNNKYGIHFTNIASGKRIVSNNIVGDNTTTGINANTAGSVIMNNTVYGNANGILLSNTDIAIQNNVFGNTSMGIAKVHDSDDHIIANNRSFANKKNGISGSGDGGTGFNDRSRHFNNIAVGNTLDGLQLQTDANTVSYNNIFAYNGDDGLDNNGAGNDTHNYNAYFSNTGSAVEGEAIDTNAVTSNPNFYQEVADRATTGGSTTTLIDSTRSWTADEWVGAGVYITNGGGTCPAGNGVWAGVWRNTSTTLFLSPALASTGVSSLCNYYITNFYTQDNSGALGAGAVTYNGASLTAGNAQTATNMGARLGYVVNDDQASSDIKHNWLQAAHDHANVNAGDTITAYAVNYRSDTLGSTLTDNGPYLTLDTATSTTIAAADDYIGFYMYMTSGTNRGKYYLIIDSTTGAPDTISIATVDGTSLNLTGFNPGDGFTIVDRVYTRRKNSTSLLNLTKGGNANGTAPITWNTNGTVIVDVQKAATYGFYFTGGGYTNISGFNIYNASDSGMRVATTNNSFSNLTIGRNTIDGIQLPRGNQVLSNITFFSNGGTGINDEVGGSSFINITVYDNSTGSKKQGSATSLYSEFRAYANTDRGISLLSSNNVVRGSISLRNTNEGISDLDGNTANRVLNNISIGNGTDGLLMRGTNDVVRNNIFMANVDDGIQYTASPNTYTFNYFFSNGRDIENSSGQNEAIEANSFTGTDPGFYQVVAQSTATGAGTNASNSTTTLRDTTQTWTVNAYVNMGLLVKNKSGQNCTAVTNSANGKWYGIVGNSVDTLVFTPALDLAIANSTTCDYYVTDFTLASTSGTTPLGNGANHAGAAAKVNMGTRLEYVENSDGTRSNGIQQAHDAGATGAGDTLTVYAVDEKNVTGCGGAACALGSTLTDSGPYIT
ncbi:MAG: right-handed parallel beta-helix repeat-containing protein, partial [Candidatus Jacksonbacteria bacterium]|nr:right-handed parallel beta-helix repeat-containing protein [Candidatus Jacksonbacteria bacterium]